MTYDSNNIFARILRQEIPATIVYEDNHVLAFNDVAPKAPVHILVIPKGPYQHFDDFTQNAPAAEVAHFFKIVGQICHDQNLSTAGYRILSNCGLNGGQEVPHFHVHICAGKRLGPIC